MRKRLIEKLSAALPTADLSQFYKSFDIIGDIAILKAANTNHQEALAVAEQLMAVHKNVKSVFTQDSPVQGDFRTRKLRLLAGENKTVTKYRESGCVFSVDVEKCYFSPRLSHERLRTAQLVESGETVVNMFAGVGCFSIVIAKKIGQVKVYSIDINPVAFEHMQKTSNSTESTVKSTQCWVIRRNWLIMGCRELPTACLCLCQKKPLNTCRLQF